MIFITILLLINSQSTPRLLIGPQHNASLLIGRWAMLETLETPARNRRSCPRNCVHLVNHWSQVNVLAFDWLESKHAVNARF